MLCAHCRCLGEEYVDQDARDLSYPARQLNFPSFPFLSTAADDKMVMPIDNHMLKILNHVQPLTI